MCSTAQAKSEAIIKHWEKQGKPMPAFYNKGKAALSRREMIGLATATTETRHKPTDSGPWAFLWVIRRGSRAGTER